ncbi:hypothetical protein Nepgr_015809 [Nepenthes gracilis]|uniref:Uncharacterized protein n=1 Tax=Nepenthes gracilis TaxID=150966 RepID=A0AAD3SLN4_NEPGR|nr:hypothetical protein Nepgr_015809 [Nepenthes gracilis]
MPCNKAPNESAPLVAFFSCDAVFPAQASEVHHEAPNSDSHNRLMPSRSACSHPVVYSISTPMETPSSPERIPCDAISFIGVQVDGNANAGIHLWGEQRCSHMPALGSDPVHFNDDGSSGMVVVDQGNAQLPEGARGSSSRGEYIPSSHYLPSPRT